MALVLMQPLSYQIEANPRAPDPMTLASAGCRSLALAACVLVGSGVQHAPAVAAIASTSRSGPVWHAARRRLM